MRTLLDLQVFGRSWKRWSRRCLVLDHERRPFVFRSVYYEVGPLGQSSPVWAGWQAATDAHRIRPCQLQQTQTTPPFRAGNPCLGGVSQWSRGAFSIAMIELVFVSFLSVQNSNQNTPYQSVLCQKIHDLQTCTSDHRRPFHFGLQLCLSETDHAKAESIHRWHQIFSILFVEKTL